MNNQDINLVLPGNLLDTAHDLLKETAGNECCDQTYRSTM
jgi:hypothetical protein